MDASTCNADLLTCDMSTFHNIRPLGVYGAVSNRFRRLVAASMSRQQSMALTRTRASLRVSLLTRFQLVTHRRPPLVRPMGHQAIRR